MSEITLSKYIWKNVSKLFQNQSFNYILKIIIVGFIGMGLASLLEQLFGDPVYSLLNSVFAWTTIVVFFFESAILIIDTFERLSIRVVNCTFNILRIVNKKRQGTAKKYTRKRNIKKSNSD